MNMYWTKSRAGYYLGSINPPADPTTTTQVPAWVVQLAERLLAQGGAAVCIPPVDAEFARIMQRGQLWRPPTFPVARVAGQPSQCHRNTVWHYEQSKVNLEICTGYALSDDKMWRQHSWLSHQRPRKPRILETTEDRVAYYGVILTQEEAAQFCEDNL
jgi:hypothetical protein